MNLGSAMKKSLVAATVAAGVVAATVPVEAQSLRRGFLPGLMGGLAIAAMAASAQAAQQQGGALYSVAPADLDDLGYWSENPSMVTPRQPVRRMPRASTARPMPRAAVRAMAPVAPAAQAGSGVIERCKASLALNARALGSVAVDVKEAGREARTRGGSVDLPVIARIKYARDGRQQVRQARVTCRLNPEGRVVAFR
jgi:hypothetical protein